MKSYIKVENSVPVKSVRRPNWFKNDGTILTDTELISAGNIYPVYDEDPVYDKFYKDLQKNPVDQWEIQEDRVVPTYEIIDFSFEEVKENLLLELKNLRLNYETGGVVFTDSKSNKLHIHSDRESQIKLIAAYQLSKEGKRTDNSTWKTIKGFKKIKNSDVITMGEVINGFIQECYNNEERITELIESTSTIDDLKNIRNNELNSGWPENALYKG